MSEPKNLVYGVAKDNSHFCEFSPEVKAELEAHPDLTLEAAIGNCVEAQNKVEIVEEKPAEVAPTV